MISIAPLSRCIKHQSVVTSSETLAKVIVHGQNLISQRNGYAVKLQRVMKLKLMSLMFSSE